MRKICAVNDLTTGTGLEFEHHGLPAVLLCSDAGVSAWINSCPHQGRNMAFAPDRFLFTAVGDLVCPHHGATFDPATGICFEGPCKGDSLTPVAIVIREGAVFCADPEE